MKIERNIFSAAVGTLNGSIGVIWGKSKVKPVLDDIRCFARQKSLTQFRLVEQFNRVSPNRAFSIAAAMVASDSELKSAGYHEKIGCPVSPLEASLVELVSYYTTWLYQSGRKVNQWNISTRHCALGLETDGAGGKGVIFLCPFGEVLSK